MHGKRFKERWLILLNKEFNFAEPNWKIKSAPRLSKQAREAELRVRTVYKDAFLFLDTHVYGRSALDNAKYCMVVLADSSLDNSNILVTGDYLKNNRGLILSKGKWSKTASEAWKSGWRTVELKMLEKLER